MLHQKPSGAGAKLRGLDNIIKLSYQITHSSLFLHILLTRRILLRRLFRTTNIPAPNIPGTNVPLTAGGVQPIYNITLF